MTDVILMKLLLCFVKREMKEVWRQTDKFVPFQCFCDQFIENYQKLGARVTNVKQ